MVKKKKEESNASNDDKQTETKNRWWTSALKRAEKVVESPEDLKKLVDKATNKANGKEDSPLKKVWDSLSVMGRIVKAYANGSYREIPWLSIVMIVGTLIYFVSPFDGIPDFIAFFGYGDDAAVVGLTVRTLAGDFEEFKEWEAEQSLKAA